MNQETRKRKQAGQVLIESMVGISVAMMGLVGVLALLTRSYSYTQGVSQRFVATYLAAEGIEVARSVVDKNYVDSQEWNRGIFAGTYVINSESADLSTMVESGVEGAMWFDAGTGIYTTENTGNTTPFRRTVSVSYPGTGANEMAIVSRVTWSAKGTENEVVLEDHFFDWRTQP